MADTETHEFDWTDDAADVVVKAQPAVAVYPGPAGVIIRLEGDFNDDDGMVWFSVDKAPAVASAILEAAGLDATDLAPKPTRVASKPMANTAAARQKRYRKRKKKEPALFDGDDRNVTERESVTPRNGVKP